MMGRDFSVLRSIQTGPGAHAISSSVGMAGGSAFAVGMCVHALTSNAEVKNGCTQAL